MSLQSNTLELESILPENISSRYHLIKKIGDGGMGNVYLAEDSQLNRMVAIKTIRPELAQNEDILDRITHECNMHAAINFHQNIIGFYDRIDAEDKIFLIMEYFEGTPLSEIIISAKQKKIELTADLIISIILQSLEALSSIHHQGIIHRDIKPSNLMVSGLESGDPTTKLMDFGIAWSASENSEVTQLTLPDTGAPGTPTYMSPERIDSETYGSICPATDLYAVGIILYEMFHLSPPFKGTLTEVLAGHIGRAPDFKKSGSFPRIIRNVVAKSLKKYPQERYQDSKSFIEALQSIELPNNDKTLPAVPIDLAAVRKAAHQKSAFPLKQFFLKKFIFISPKVIFSSLLCSVLVALVMWQGIPLILNLSSSSSGMEITKTTSEKLLIAEDQRLSNPNNEKIRPLANAIEKSVESDQMLDELPDASMKNNSAPKNQERTSFQASVENPKQENSQEHNELSDNESGYVDGKAVILAQEEIIGGAIKTSEGKVQISSSHQKELTTARIKKSYNYIDIPEE